MTAAELESIPFFAQLTEDERLRVARCAKRTVVPAGLMITTLGERGDEFYVIEDGRAVVSQEEDWIGELGPGDFFGELTLFDEEWRTASVLAATTMHLIVLTENVCGDLLADNPHLAERLAAAARERLARDQV